MRALVLIPLALAAFFSLLAFKPWHEAAPSVQPTAAPELHCFVKQKPSDGVTVVACGLPPGTQEDEVEFDYGHGDATISVYSRPRR